MKQERLDELHTILGISEDEWESVTVEELLEKDDLDYDVVGLEDLRRTYDYTGKRTFVRHLQVLKHLTLQHVDVWVNLDAGRVLRNYRITLLEEIFPDE